MKYGKETWVGLFVLIGIAAIGYLSIQLGDLRIFSQDYYRLTAEFSDISGLKEGAPVEIFGVQAGYVSAIKLDMEKQAAVVDILVRKRVTLHDDAIAAVKTSGLIGDKFIKVKPGGFGEELKPGDAFFETESALDLESLISKYAFGGTK
ncbi:MAG: outer membrane lipid asymmetry maintenance protein MlaD [Desulfovibrionaceae bacterium]